MACDKHVVKMILESAQMLCSVQPEGTAPYKRSFYNHPCTKWLRTSDANYDWFHMDPKIRILTIGKLDLSPIYNLEGQEFEAALLLNKEVKEIEDWVSDFITDCQYGLDEDVFKKLLN